MRELGIVEVRVATEDDTPVLILKEAEGPRHLAIWMTAAGAAGILAALEDPDVDHPSPHDLVVDLCELLGHRVKAVQLVGHQEGTFYAEVLVDDVELPARPSDALAIALRAGVPILCAEGVLAAVGFDPEADASPPEQVVEAFREFLDSVNPDDFEDGEP